jgi:hypothetical protein
MNLTLEKEIIKRELDTVYDESTIQAVKRALGLVKDKHLQTLTKEDIIARALESERAIKQGHFITLEELEEEMKNW